MTPLRSLVLASMALLQAWGWATASRPVDARWSFCAWLLCATPFLVGIALSSTPRGVLFFVANVFGGAASAVLNARRFEDGVGLLGGHAAWQIALAACLVTTWVLLPIAIASFVPWLRANPWRVFALMLALFVVLEASRVSIFLKDEVINQGAANGRITENAVVRVYVLYVLTAVALALTLPRELRSLRSDASATRAETQPT